MTALWALVLSGACTVVDNRLDGATLESDVCEGGVCARTTEGCDASDIDQREDRVCASCEGPSGDVEICGVPEVARCESREDQNGAPCRFCATARGELLYDACFTAQKPAAVACESVPSSPESVPGGGDGIAPTEDVVCQTCTDATGRVVSTHCEPIHDECHEEEADGRRCRICTRNGEVVISACEEPRLEPRSCEAYADEDGRCVDCYDDNDQLILHTCSFTTEDVGCSQILTDEGLTCEVCTDSAGAVVSRACSGEGARLQRCTLLDFSDQSCLVCLDQFGDIGLTRCQSTTCTDATCPPPPSCAWEVSSTGQWCRACPVEGAGGTEVRCIEETNLMCSAEPTFDSTGESQCVVCLDAQTNLEVYRRCDAMGAPPACTVVEREDGERCEICKDPQTGQQIYATCAEDTCYALGAYQLFAADGGALAVDGEAAVASCSSCVASDAAVTNEGAVTSATCTLRAQCSVATLTAPDAPCEGSVVFTLLPRMCGNPWAPDASADQVAVPGDVGEALAVMQHALEVAGLGLLSVSSHPAGMVPCAEGCACPRGDIIEVAVRAQDAIAARSLYEDVVVPCADAGSCAPGGVCRIDGACGY